MNRAVAAAILLAVGTAAATAQGTSLGSISGVVVNDGGKPVPRAKLGYTKLTEYARDKDGHMTVKEPGFTRSVTVGADGTFALSGLPTGRYDICAYGSQPNQTSGCEWDGGTVIPLADGQSIQGLTRRVYDGAIITFRVADPNGRIALPEANGKVVKERRFFLGVSSPSGYYHRSELVSSTGVQHVFRVVIPKQKSVRLFIDTDLPVTHSRAGVPQSEIPVETRQPSSILISSAGSDQVALDLTVK